MTKESRFLLEIWEQVRDLLPVSKRADVANALVREFAEFGYDERDLQDVVDEDAYLTRAYNDVFDLEADEDSDSDDSED